jgi:AhpD family alkylhydroperoxidase
MVMVIVKLLLGQDHRLWGWQAVRANSPGLKTTTFLVRIDSAVQELNITIAKSGQPEPLLGYLVDIRASQMNGCAFCLDMHVKEAKLHGEREQFDEKALSTLVFRIMVINAWNRANVAFRTTPGIRDKFFGLDKAGLA